MNTWVLISWIFVALLTAGNVFFFLKLKKASDQMMKMAFPGARNMNEALGQMQQRMNQRGPMANPFLAQKMGGRKGKKGKQDSQLEAAMGMLEQMTKGKRP